MVGLLEAGVGERAGDEFAGFGSGAGGRLVRVEGAAVEFWRSKFVSRGSQRRRRVAFAEKRCC